MLTDSLLILTYF